MRRHSDGLFGPLAVLLTTFAVQADDGLCDSATVLKIPVTADGAYRIPGAAVRSALGCDALRLEQLRLSNHGEATRHAMLDGDVVFFGSHLAGENSYYNEFSQANVYRLSRAESSGPEKEANTALGLERLPSAINVRSHLEEEKIRVRFPGREGAPQPEVWYWARANSIDREPFEVALDLRWRRFDSVPVIRVGLRGWSRLPQRKFPDLPDHRIEVLLNDHPIGAGEWQDQEEFVLEIEDIPATILGRGRANRLSLRVPERTPPGESAPLIDAVLVNWIEVDFRRNGVLSEGQHALRIRHQNGGWFRLSGLGETAPIVISETGHLLAPMRTVQRGRRYWHDYRTISGVSDYVAVVGEAFLPSPPLLADTPSNLRDRAQQADYLILTHRRLRQAIEPLAEFHRQGGLSVQVIDIEDVYDEFNYGVLAPSAIRDFVSYAYHHWQSPRPRFVLLVGDASWDVHNETGNDRGYADWTFNSRESGRFLKNKSSAYEDGGKATERNLIPTWPVDTYEGYAASDNVFVAVEGADFLPDLAIGRFPVSQPADVTAIVNKTIAYHRQGEVGPWRRKVLWITNEQIGLQRTSDRLDETMTRQGFTGTKVYPSRDENDNAAHQVTLQKAFDEGQLLVHFIGHGGRYIWRTGPPDISKNHDLFTLDHLETLTPTHRLPFVLSMTCYSAPFDHPTADSIGEKFLRLPDRGAIGILAASWRNSPGLAFSQAMLDALTQPGTIGEAVMRAKQSQTNRLMIETYNLLGDPAARLALPSHHIKLKTRQRRDYLEISGRVVDARFDGQVMIDWQDSQGMPIRNEQIGLRRGKFRLRLDRDVAAEIGAIRAYAWNAEQNVDAMGGLSLAKSDGPAKVAQKRATRVDRKSR